MTISPRKRCAIAAVAAAIAVTGLWGAPRGASAAEISCGDVVIIGARGSGEAQTGTSQDGLTGMGSHVFAAAQRITGALSAHGATVAVLAAQYPAASVQTLSTNPTAYFQGLETGVGWTKQTLTDRANACPSERIILLGYSQGAMVMHRTVQDLDASGSAITPRIDGVLLLGDGDRDSTDGTRGYGTAKRGFGIARQFPSLSGARSTTITKPLRKRVHGVCDLGDSVCNFTSVTALTGDIGQSVHVTHYQDSRPVRKADQAIVRQVKVSLAQ